MLIRRDDLRDTMSNYLAQRLLHDERVTVHPRSELCGVHGTKRLSALTWRDHRLGRDVALDASAVFLMIGADPHTGWLVRQASGIGGREGSVVIAAVHSYLAGLQTS